MCWSSLLYTFPQSDLNNVRFLFHPGIIFSFRTIANISLFLEKNSLFFLKKLCGRFACFLCNPNTFLCLKKKSTASLFLQNKMLIFSEEIMRHVSSAVLVLLSLQKGWSASLLLKKKNQEHHYFFRTKCWFFSEEIMRHVSSAVLVLLSVPKEWSASLLLQKKKSSTLSFLTR